VGRGRPPESGLWPGRAQFAQTNAVTAAGTFPDGGDGLASLANDTETDKAPYPSSRGPQTATHGPRVRAASRTDRPLFWTLKNTNERRLLTYPKGHIKCHQVYTFGCCSEYEVVDPAISLVWRSLKQPRVRGRPSVHLFSHGNCADFVLYPLAPSRRICHRRRGDDRQKADEKIGCLQPLCVSLPGGARPLSLYRPIDCPSPDRDQSRLLGKRSLDNPQAYSQLDLPVTLPPQVLPMRRF
jgi:hypothetical protein